MNRQLREGSSYLNKLGTFVAGVDTLSQELRTTANALQNTTSTLKKSLDDLLLPVSALEKQQQGLLNGVNQSATYMQNAAKRLDELSKQQQQWGTSFISTLNKIEIVAQKADTLASRVGEFTRQQTEFLAQIKSERNEQSKLTDRMLHATSGFDEATRLMDEATKQLRFAVADTNNLLRLYAALPPTTRADINDIVTSYQHAAQVFEQSTSASQRELIAGATAIYNASAALQKVVDELRDKIA